MTRLGSEAPRMADSGNEDLGEEIPSVSNANQLDLSPVKASHKRRRVHDATFRNSTNELEKMQRNKLHKKETKVGATTFITAGRVDDKRKKVRSSKVNFCEQPSDPDVKAPALQLPAWKKCKEILRSIRKHPVTIIVGETGSGKTTQIPQMLLQTGKYKRIALTQPRRIAAITIASKLSQEVRERAAIDTAFRSSLEGVDGADKETLHRIGGIIGYSVRFQSKYDPHMTRLKVLTDGMLIREAIHDSKFRKYNVIMIDEAHERTVRGDILLGLLKNALNRETTASLSAADHYKSRPPLKVVVMSATLDYEAYVSFFGKANVVVIPGRQHAVGLHHLIRSSAVLRQLTGQLNEADCSSQLSPFDRDTKTEAYLEQTAAACIQQHVTAGTAHGDILCFLPGQEEIERVHGFIEFAKDRLNRLRKLFAICNDLIRRFLSLSPISSLTRNDTAPLDFAKLFKSTDIDLLRNPQADPSLIQDEHLRSFVATLSSEERSILSRLVAMLNQNVDISQLSLRYTVSRDEPGFVNISPLLKTGEESVLFDSNSGGISSEGGLLDLRVVELYAALSLDKQQRAFKPGGPTCRKIILATNIAETSLTISNVRYVIDSGRAKVKLFNPRTRIGTLQIQQIARSSANQRAGRAGREGPGDAIRLYTTADYYSMDVVPEPEIKRADLAQVILELKALGIQDIDKFPFLTKPSGDSLTSAISRLVALHAVDKVSKSITARGRQLICLPVAPEFGSFILESIDFHCTAEALILVAIFNTDSIQINFSRRSPGMVKRESKVTSRALRDPTGDHCTLVNIFRTWEATPVHNRKELSALYGISHRNLCKAQRIRDQLRAIVQKPPFGLESISSCLEAASFDNKSGVRGFDPLLRCLVKCFPEQVARYEPSDKHPNSFNNRSKPKSKFEGVTQYVIEAGRIPCSVHPSSVLFAKTDRSKYLVFNELTETSKLYMRNVTEVKTEWIQEFHPHLIASAAAAAAAATAASYLRR